jgi:hypothetical protein
MLACIHSRKFSAAIVGAAIILGGTSVDCYSQTGSIHLTVVKAAPGAAQAPWTTKAGHIG